MNLLIFFSTLVFSNHAVIFMKARPCQYKREATEDYVNMNIQNNAMHIKKVCAKYFGSKSPWLPIASQIHVTNFYMDKQNKIGWCVNPKVRFIFVA